MRITRWATIDSEGEIGAVMYETEEQCRAVCGMLAFDFDMEPIQLNITWKRVRS